jgi:hypothetical protein
MKVILYISFFLSTVSHKAVAQNVNLMIQVNETLIYDLITDVYIKVGTDSDSKRLNVSYVPGDLILSEDAWNIINADTSKKISLHFTYLTPLKNHLDTAAFYCDLTRPDFKQPYLILNIYDFRDKKHRYRYQNLTNKNFLAELTYPGSPRFIRNDDPDHDSLKLR